MTRVRELPEVRIVHYVVALLVPLSWSFSFIAGRAAMRETPGGPATVTLMRFAAALAPLLVVIPYRKPIGPLSARDWRRILLLGLLCVGGYHYLFFKGLTHAPAGMSSVVLAVLPILVNIGAGLFLGETVGRRTYLGAVIAFTAIAIIALEKGGWSLRGWGRGETYILGAALCWLFYTLAARSTFMRFDPAVASVYVFVIGTVLVLPVAAFEPPFRSLATRSGQWWACMLYMGLVATGFGYVGYNYCIRHLGAGRTALFLLIIPPVTNVWGRLLFDEPLTPVKSACILAVVFGVRLALKR